MPSLIEPIENRISTFVRTLDHPIPADWQEARALLLAAGTTIRYLRSEEHERTIRALPRTPTEAIDADAEDLAAAQAWAKHEVVYDRCDAALAATDEHEPRASRRSGTRDDEEQETYTFSPVRVAKAYDEIFAEPNDEELAEIAFRSALINNFAGLPRCPIHEPIGESA